MIRLSPEQRAAVAVRSGPVRVIAGAGTGKTAVIAARYADLVRSGVTPSSILVMTFTERAAAEMRSRIETASGVPVGTTQVGTFHAVCQSWLREDGGLARVPAGFRIVSGAERWILARELMWELGDPDLTSVERPDEQVANLLKVLERLKQEMIPLSALERWSAAAGPEAEGAPLLAAAARLFRAYEQRCRDMRLLDFDDLLLRAVSLLADRPEVRARYAARYPWILVDEYQDTNLAQERLVELLAQPAGNVCIVGDDDQSIYRFRGASRASMDRFERAFPRAVTRTLTRNRRSTRNIVSAAEALIVNNEGRLSKTTVAPAPAGPAVEIWHCPDGNAEARAVAGSIGAGLAGGLDPSEIAILARTNALMRPFLEALAEAGIPHRVWGSQGFYSRPEVRDVVAVLRVVADPDDVIALARVAPIHLPEERRPGLVVDLAGAHRARSPLVDVLAGPGRLGEWAASIADLHRLSSSMGVADLFFEVMSRTGYAEGLQRLPAAQREAANAAISRFAELIAEFCERTPDQSLRAYLQHLELVLLSGLDEEVPSGEALSGAVSVMTIHQAKGLEFDTVYVPSLVEGRLPQPPRQERLRLPPAILEPAVRGREDHLAEERRLCYVAMTRARRRLVLTRAVLYEGGRPWRPSRFLDEIAGAGRRGVRETTLDAAPEAVTVARIAVPIPPDLELSFSGVAAYRECPRQHWYRYVARLPAAPTMEGEFGSAVHRALMRAGRLRQEGNLVGPADLDRELDRAWAEASFPDPRREPVYRALGGRLLHGYADRGGLLAVPLLVEAPFAVRIDGIGLRGTIDRADPPAGGEGSRIRGRAAPHRLIDYKTGASVPVSRLRRDLQLALYALAAREAFGFERVELEVVHLREGTSSVIPAGDALLREAGEILSEVAQGVAAARFEPRPERRRCRLCPYRLTCPDSM